MTADLSLGDFTPPMPATSNGHGPAAVPGLPATAVAAAGDGDWALVRELSGRVGDRLTEALKAREQRGQRLDEDAKQQLGRALIEDELRALIRARAELGEPTPAPQDEEWLRRAVFAVQFGVGRLSALLEQDDVENIIVAGCDQVQLKLADGRLVAGPPVAESDEELLELINRIGTRLGSAERSLSAAHPHFRMSLPDGSRLSALAYVCPRPQLAIRRHRIADKDLDDLVGMGMISQSLRAFLGALVRGRKSVLIVGPQDAGKTSLMRSMLHECPPSERVATIESEYELHLHRDPVRHPWVLPLEARPGSSERSGAGEVTLSDLVRMSLGQVTARLAVGEVLSDEIMPMLNAMMAGGSGGSMCTLHADSARDAFERIAVLCTQAKLGMTAETAYRFAAKAIKYVVVVDMVDERAIGGRQHRYVREVAHVAGVGVDGLPDLGEVYKAGEDGRAVPQGRAQAPDVLALRRIGFDADWLDPANGGWERPLQLLVTE